LVYSLTSLRVRSAKMSIENTFYTLVYSLTSLRVRSANMSANLCIVPPKDVKGFTWPRDSVVAGSGHVESELFASRNTHEVLSPVVKLNEAGMARRALSWFVYVRVNTHTYTHTHTHTQHTYTRTQV